MRFRGSKKKHQTPTKKKTPVGIKLEQKEKGGWASSLSTKEKGKNAASGCTAGVEKEKSGKEMLSRNRFSRTSDVQREIGWTNGGVNAEAWRRGVSQRF